MSQLPTEPRAVSLRVSEDMERLYLEFEDGPERLLGDPLDVEHLIPPCLYGAYERVLAEVEDGETAALAYMAEADRIWRNR
jgi:hypothetical protein